MKIIYFLFVMVVLICGADVALGSPCAVSGFTQCHSCDAQRSIVFDDWFLDAAKSFVASNKTGRTSVRMWSTMTSALKSETAMIISSSSKNIKERGYGACQRDVEAALGADLYQQLKMIARNGMSSRDVEIRAFSVVILSQGLCDASSLSVFKERYRKLIAAVEKGREISLRELLAVSLGMAFFKDTTSAEFLVSALGRKVSSAAKVDMVKALLMVGRFDDIFKSGILSGSDKPLAYYVFRMFDGNDWKKHAVIMSASEWVVRLSSKTVACGQEDVYFLRLLAWMMPHDWRVVRETIGEVLFLKMQDAVWRFLESNTPDLLEIGADLSFLVISDKTAKRVLACVMNGQSKLAKNIVLAQIKDNCSPEELRHNATILIPLLDEMDDVLRLSGLVVLEKAYGIHVNEESIGDKMDCRIEKVKKIAHSLAEVK